MQRAKEHFGDGLVGIVILEPIGPLKCFIRVTSDLTERRPDNLDGATSLQEPISSFKILLEANTSEGILQRQWTSVFMINRSSTPATQTVRKKTHKNRLHPARLSQQLCRTS
jgi:hypothetical protein